MRYAMLMKHEISKILDEYEKGALSRDDAHLELHSFQLLDVEIADLLDEIDEGKRAA